ncbi:MAG: L7Ae/L30e/S12e/Gadd45 family ribosomal protein [Fervidicoccus fontis]
MSSPLAFLGLAKKAGKLAVGFTSCLEAIRSKRAKLVIIARDAGVDKKKIVRACQENKTEYIEFGTKDEFQKVLGRPSCFWAILSKELSEGFLAKTQEEEEEDRDGLRVNQDGGGD